MYVDQRYYARVDCTDPRTHDLFNENVSTRHWIPLYELLANNIPDVLKATQAIAISLDCPLNLDGCNHALIVGHWEININLTRKINFDSVGRNYARYWERKYRINDLTLDDIIVTWQSSYKLLCDCGLPYRDNQVL